MMDKMKKLELDIIELIIESNTDDYRFLKWQLPFLSVTSREYTQVGAYINFVITGCNINDVVTDANLNTVLSVPKLLRLDTLSNELSFELDIKNGQINFIEIVTNGGEPWDGQYSTYEFIDW